MLSTIKYFFGNGSSYTPLQKIVIIPHNDQNYRYIDLKYDSLPTHYTDSNLIIKHIQWPPNNHF